MNFKIIGYSTALFSTWFFVEELGILFDCGDGVMSMLMQKSRKVKNVFISHADRDHLTGIFQFNQLNARDGLVIHYPADSGSFPAIANFTMLFDPQSTGTIWQAISDGEKMVLNKNLFVQAIRNNHVQAPEGIHKSLSYKIFQTKRKLKPEFANRSPEELKTLAQKEGQDFITAEVSDCILGYSGDTPVEDYSRWDGTKLLIHEATFLDQHTGAAANRNKHSNLEDVLKMVSEINIETLILSHFSSRYSKEEIDDSIQKYCKAFQIRIPVYRLLPGEVHQDILSGSPINS